MIKYWADEGNHSLMVFTGKLVQFLRRDHLVWDAGISDLVYQVCGLVPFEIPAEIYALKFLSG